MDLGRPGIGLSRDLSLLHLTLQVCSDWSWQQSTGQAHIPLSLCWSPLVTTGHHCWSNGGWAPHGPGQSTPGTSHCCISLCKCVLTGPGNRVLVRHTHSLSLCWSPLVTTGHHCWSNGGWDLGTPGIGHSRGPATEYWSAHCSPLSLSAGHSTPWTWAGLWNWALWAGLWNWHGTPWTWAGLWNWALHGPGLVCGIGHSMDLGWSVELRTLGWSVELGTLWTWAVFTLAPLKLGAPWAWGLWSLWIWDTPRTWGLPIPPNSLSLCCTECLFPPLWHSGRESINTNGGPDGPTPHYS